MERGEWIGFKCRKTGNKRSRRLKTSNQQQRQQQWNAGGGNGNGRDVYSGNCFANESFVRTRPLADWWINSIVGENLLLSRGRILFSHSVLSILLKKFPLPFWIPIDTCALKMVGWGWSLLVSIPTNDLLSTAVVTDL